MRVRKILLHVSECRVVRLRGQLGTERSANLFKSEGLCPSLLKYHNQLQSLSFFGVRLIKTPMSGAALLPS